MYLKSLRITGYRPFRDFIANFGQLELLVGANGSGKSSLFKFPQPPALMCIDEPDQGVHPRTLPILAGPFEKACERTQIILATHSSYFLVNFHLSRLAVLRKQENNIIFIKPDTSRILLSNLEDFGQDEIELMHRNDELEVLL